MGPDTPLASARSGLGKDSWWQLVAGMLGIGQCLPRHGRGCGGLKTPSALVPLSWYGAPEATSGANSGALVTNESYKWLG